jgi:hypothetical protein
MDIIKYFGDRGREYKRDLKIEDFAETIDGDGNMYIKDELTKIIRIIETLLKSECMQV